LCLPWGGLSIDPKKLAFTPKKCVKERDILRRGDLLFNWRNGSQHHLGKTAYFDSGDECTHVGFLLKIRTRKEACDSRFLWFLINHIKSKGYFLTAKIQVNNTFNSGELNSVLLAVPPLAEQESIRARLDEVELAKTVLSARLRKLEALKTALMQDLLTGKKRVTPLLEQELNPLIENAL
jgi:type I restriction enzyme S subunit